MCGRPPPASIECQWQELAWMTRATGDTEACRSSAVGISRTPSMAANPGAWKRFRRGPRREVPPCHNSGHRVRACNENGWGGPATGAAKPDR
jgi:hypothetical protein